MITLVVIFYLLIGVRILLGVIAFAMAETIDWMLSEGSEIKFEFSLERESAIAIIFAILLWPAFLFSIAHSYRNQVEKGSIGII